MSLSVLFLSFIMNYQSNGELFLWFQCRYWPDWNICNTALAATTVCKGYPAWYQGCCAGPSSASNGDGPDSGQSFFSYFINWSDILSFRSWSEKWKLRQIKLINVWLCITMWLKYKVQVKWKYLSTSTAKLQLNEVLSVCPTSAHPYKVIKRKKSNVIDY